MTTTDTLKYIHYTLDSMIIFTNIFTIINARKNFVDLLMLIFIDGYPTRMKVERSYA
jgi:hypothetical protein